ncbi:RES family NAD+ phosphorylase [soil metagenome]
MLPLPKQIELQNQFQFHIIAAVFPPINFFEDLVDAAEMQTLFEIESITNERIRLEVGDIFLIANEDCVSGPGSSVVMAAFTHIGKPSRFTDGSYGIYYAGLSQETAIKETVYHREQFLQATNEAAGEITMCIYQGTLAKPLHDLCPQKFHKLHHPNNYSEPQVFAKKLRKSKSWGVIYNSVRHAGGKCVAAFRPPAVSIPKQAAYLRYVWNGEKITTVFEIKLVE